MKSRHTNFLNDVASCVCDPNQTIYLYEGEQIINALKKNHGIGFFQKVNSFNTFGKQYNYTNEIANIVTDFMGFLSVNLLNSLPSISISIGHYNNTLGSWNSTLNDLMINENLLCDYDGFGNLRSYETIVHELRVTLYHELMHWVHLKGPYEYYSDIRNHFDNRTIGKPLIELEGYVGYFGYDGGFFEAYMGSVSTGIAVEIPTRCAELLADTFSFVEHFNHPRHRETLEVFATIFGY